MAAQTFTLRLQSQRGGGARLSSFIHFPVGVRSYVGHCFSFLAEVAGSCPKLKHVLLGWSP